MGLFAPHNRIMKRRSLIPAILAAVLVLAVLAGSIWLLSKKEASAAPGDSPVLGAVSESAVFGEAAVPLTPAPEPSGEGAVETDPSDQTAEPSGEVTEPETYVVTDLTPLPERLLSLQEAYDQSVFGERVVITAEGYLNIRRQGSPDAEVIGKIYRGCIADIVERGEDFTLISSGRVTGWVSNAYVLSGREGMEFAEENSTYTATVTADKLNIRETESEEGVVLATVEKGQSFIVEAIREKWVKIAYTSAIDGWVSREHVTLNMNMGEAVSVEEERQLLALYQKKAQERESIAESIAESSKAERIAKESKEAVKKTTATLRTEAERPTEKPKPETEAPKPEDKPTEAPAEPKPTEAPQPSELTTDDLHLLGALCYCEAGSRYENCLPVAITIMNRVRSSRFPNSVYDVIYQKGQYSPAKSGWLEKVLAAGVKSGCLEAAAAALAGETTVNGEEFTYLFFCAPRVAKYEDYARYVQIGDNVFYEKK